MVSFFNSFLSIIIELSQRTDVMSGKGDILALRASKEYETGFLRLYASSDQGESWTLVSDFAEIGRAHV